MQNLNDYMNCLNSLIKTTINIVFIVLIISSLNPAQNQQYNDSTGNEESSGFVMQKSPWGAVARSAIIPGWGQFYNEEYLHIPVIWGFLGWFAYNWVQNNNEYKRYSDLYINTEINGYKDYRDFYRDQRDRFTIYFTIVYFLNLVDAFVGANLFDFSVEEDYRINNYRLNINYNF